MARREKHSSNARELLLNIRYDQFTRTSTKIKREQLADQLEKFKANGGSVIKVGAPELQENYAKKRKWFEEKKWKVAT